MRRITVAIEDKDLARLRELADRERRDPRDQAAVLLSDALRRAALRCRLDCASRAER